MSINRNIISKTFHTNDNLNIGFSSRSLYDSDAFYDKTFESVSPLYYQLDPNRIYNKNKCFQMDGPRPSFGGPVGLYVDDYLTNKKLQDIAPSLVISDASSYLSNRNTFMGKSKISNMNFKKPKSFPLTSNSKTCGTFLNDVSTRLTTPQYRELSINRFLDIMQNPQYNIFWDFSINTQLEAKDNFVPKIPHIMTDYSLPNPKSGKDTSDFNFTLGDCTNCSNPTQKSPNPKHP